MPDEGLETLRCDRSPQNQLSPGVAQADFLKLLYDKMLELHRAHADGPEEWKYALPSFKVVVLYVEQEESVRRQLGRAQLAAKHNTRVLDAGVLGFRV